jgi:hypothetical protein
MAISDASWKTVLSPMLRAATCTDGAARPAAASRRVLFQRVVKAILVVVVHIIPQDPT